MTAKHNNPPRCCCPWALDVDTFEPVRPCPCCPEHGNCRTHGELAGPYTEQETTK